MASKKKNEYNKSIQLIILVLASIIFGALITSLLTASETWKSNDGCVYAGQSQTAYTVVLRSNPCANLAYGYPSKFITTKSVVSLSKLPAVNLRVQDINSASEISLDGKALATDLILWSVVSFAVLFALYAFDKSRQRRKNNG